MAKTGRPPKYKTPEEMDKAIDAYFDGGFIRTKKINLKGDTVEVCCPTITDLVLYLGFCDRSAFYKYEEKEEFRHTIKRARTMIERDYEIRLDSAACTGAIFALKNLGWSDKREVEHTGKESKIIVVYPSAKKKPEESNENRVERIPGGVPSEH